MKAYKGFDKDLKCRGFQYEVGKEYEEERAKVCECGFHSCLNPLDVFSYYAPADENGYLNRFCEVEIPDEMDKSDDDSKVSTKKIKINAEIGLKGLVEAGVHFILEKVNWKDDKSTNTGDESSVANTGDYSAATNTGYRSAAINTGYRSAAINTGDESVAINTGDESSATNTGYRSAASVEGNDSIAIATGYRGKAKGSLGCYIVIAERDENFKLIDVKTAKVDDKTIKADTYYTLINGEFVEVN